MLNSYVIVITYCGIFSVMYMYANKSYYYVAMKLFATGIEFEFNDIIIYISYYKILFIFEMFVIFKYLTF